MKVTLIRSRAIDPAINKIAETLSENGYDVKLLVWDRTSIKKVDCHNKYITYKCNIKAPYDKLTVLFYLPFWWLYEFIFLLKDDSKIIHACDLDTLIPAIFVKFIKRVKIFYFIYDFTADTLPRKIPSIIRRFVAFTEKFLIRFTQILFLVDECRYEQVKGAKINMIEYIYNSPPHYLFHEATQKSKTEKMTIFYAGTLHKTRGLNYIIRAVEDMDNVRLIIGGIGPEKSLFEDLPLDLMSKIHYIGYIPYKKVIEETLESDILFAFYDPNIINNRYASPNKLFEAMMCGKPIIVNSEAAASRIVSTENCGLIVPYGDVGAIREAILKLKNDPDLRMKLGANGRNAYEKKYGWEIMKQKILNAYNALE